MIYTTARREKLHLHVPRISNDRPAPSEQTVQSAKLTNDGRAGPLEESIERDRYRLGAQEFKVLTAQTPDCASSCDG